MKIDTNDLIESMRDIIECYDSIEICQKEIRMWRQRYLDSLDLDSNRAEKCYVHIYFMALPSESILKTSIENQIKSVRKFFEPPVVQK